MPSGLGLATVREAIEREALTVGDFAINSTGCTIVAGNGQCVSKTVQLNPGAGAQVQNLFAISGGPVRIHEIYFVVTSVSNSNTFSNVKFQLDDGLAQEDVTNTVDASGCSEDAMVSRVNTGGNAAQFDDADHGSVIEPAVAGNKTPLVAFIILPKSNTTCYLRLSYTADGDTDLTIIAVARWSPMIPGAQVAQVA